MRNTIFFIPLAFLLVLSVACDDDDGNNTNQTTVSGYSCVRDPSLMARTTQCRLDIHCPCGTHCEEGLCQHQCMSDDECEDGAWCDYFGRCRSQEVRSSFAPLSEGESGSIAMTPQYINMYENAGPKP